jgi:hypothetical protein
MIIKNLTRIQDEIDAYPDIVSQDLDELYSAVENALFAADSIKRTVNYILDSQEKVITEYT